MLNKVIIRPDNIDKETGVKSYNVNPGSTIILEAVPKDGCKFEKWTDEYINPGLETSSQRKEKIDKDGMNFKASFKECDYVVNVNSNSSNKGQVFVESNGIKDEKSLVLRYGDRFNIIAIPGDNYTFERWDGIVGELSKNSEIRDILADEKLFDLNDDSKRVYTALFSDLYHVILIANANGRVSIDGGKPNKNVIKEKIRRGETIKILAIPESGYSFKEWNDSGSTDFKKPERVITVNGNSTYIATFDISKKRILFNAIPENSGSFFDRTSGNNNTPVKYIDAEVGSTIAVEAKPNEGYNFVKWKDENLDNIRKIDVDENTNTFEALFEKLICSIYFEKLDDENGTVTVNDKLVYNDKYEYGTFLRINALPNEKNDMIFKRWEINYKDVSEKNPINIIIKENLSIIPIFEKKLYKLLVTSNKKKNDVIVTVNGREGEDNKVNFESNGDVFVDIKSENISGLYKFYGWRLNDYEIINRNSEILNNFPMRGNTGLDTTKLCSLYSNNDPVFLNIIKDGKETKENYVECTCNSPYTEHGYEYYIGEKASFNAINHFRYINADDPTFKEPQAAFKAWVVDGNNRLDSFTIEDITENMLLYPDVNCVIDTINESIMLRFGYVIDNNESIEDDKKIKLYIGPFIKNESIWNNNIFFNETKNIYTVEKLSSGNRIEVIPSIDKNSGLVFDRWEHITKHGIETINTEHLENVYAQTDQFEEKYIAHFKKNFSIL